MIRPRTGGATSVPGILSIFHNVRPGARVCSTLACYQQANSFLFAAAQEWDALMLETYQLKETLDSRNKVSYLLPCPSYLQQSLNATFFSGARDCAVPV